MKPNSTFLKSKKLAILLLSVLFSMSISAQLEWTGLEKLVPDSISLVDDITVYNLTHSKHVDAGGPSNGTEVTGVAIEYINGNDWIEYQIISPTTGNFAAVIPIASKRGGSYTNVSVYKVDSAFVMNGQTTFTYNNEWQAPDPYIFPFMLEAGIVYNMRVTFVDEGCNIFNDGFFIKELDGPADASLKDIAIGGVTIPGFSPDVYEYTIALEPDVWIDGLTADATDATAEVDVPEIAEPEEGVKATSKIVCTSLSGVSLTYTVNVVMPTEVFDGGTLELNSYDIFYSGGAVAAGSKLNSFANNEYLEYYIFSAYDDNMAITLSCTNGYTDANSYLNVSTLAMDDSTWAIDDRHSQLVPITYKLDDPTSGEWSGTNTVPNDLSYIIQLKEYEPVRLRIYGITNKGNTADVLGISFDVVTDDIDNTLSEITIDGTVITDFDAATTNYTVPLAAGVTQVEIGATPNSADAEVTSGTGTFDIINGTAEIVCTSEAGYPLTYRVSFETPKMILAGDTLVMGDDAYYTSGNVRAANNKVNYLGDSMYVEYYIYSATSEDMHVTILAGNGYLLEADTVYDKLNIGTYNIGTEWSPEMGITKDIASDGWNTEFASEYEYNISLVANEPVLLRIFSFTNANTNTVADIFKITFGDGHTTAGGEDDGVPAGIREVAMANNISVITAKGSLSVIGDETMLGASVKVYDISGRLIVNKIANSTHESYDINQSGLYIVRVVSPENAVSTVKCIVR